MLQDNFLEVYDKFKLEFFRRIFELVREREGSVSAMEAFSIEIIDALNGFLETLSATERGVFMRRYWMMEPVADVAARYDISVSKTTTMLFRLRGRLKKHFMKEGISL